MGKSVAVKSIWSVATQFGVLFGGAISSVILNRYLKPEGRGEVALVMFWPTFVAYLLVSGWIPAVVAHVSRQPQDSRPLWTAWVLSGLALAVPVTLVGWFLIPYYLPTDPELWSLNRWYLLFIFFTVLGPSAQAVLEANGHFDLAGVARISQVVFLLPALVVLALCGLLDPGSYVLLMLGLMGFMNLTSVLLMAWTTKGAWTPAFFNTPPYFLRAVPFDWIREFQQRADQTLILALLPTDSTAFGSYVAGTALGGLLSPVATGLAPVLFTHGAAQTESEALRLCLQMGRAFVLFCLLMGVPAALVADLILRWAYGPEFEPAAPAMRVALLNSMLGGLFLMFINTLRAINHPGTATLIGIASYLISIVGTVVLLAPLGYVGATVGQTLGYSSGLGLTWLLFRGQGLSLSELLPKGEDFGKGFSLVKEFWRICRGYGRTNPSKPNSASPRETSG